MNKIPSNITHLYVNPGGPFQSISELHESEALCLMDKMTDSNTWHPPRFSKEKRVEYMASRHRSEKRLYEEFVKKGGLPRREHPYYFFLDTPDSQAFYPNVKRIHVPLNSIPSEVISFTYLDSMVCDAILSNPDYRVPPNCKRFSGLSCLNEVYRLEELPSLIDEFGFPEGTYLEAQVWDDSPLEPYRKKDND